jgi:hypothetical protein
MLGNVSSRPGKRNDGQKDGALTPESFKGAEPELTNQRAIGSEKMCSHSGTQLISWYSARQGLEAIIDKGVKEGMSDEEKVQIRKSNREEIPLMYEHDKSTRDTFRSAAISLFMIDFSVAWEMLAGEKQPSSEEIKQLNQEYVDGKTDGDEKTNNRRTLAYIETEALETAKLVYYMINGKDADESLTLKTILDELWPKLAEEIEDRESRISFNHKVEAAYTKQINAMNPKEEIPTQTLQILRTFYAGSDQTNAPVGSMFTSTTRDADKAKDDLEMSEVDWKKLMILDDGQPSPSLSPRERSPLGQQTQEVVATM